MNAFNKMMMVVMSVSLAGPVFANEGKHRKHPRRSIEERVQNQGRRIDQKVAKGKMTEEEAKAEKEKVSAITSEHKELVKDNGEKPLNKEQRKKLHKELNETSKEIKAAGSSAAAVVPVSSPVKP